MPFRLKRLLPVLLLFLACCPPAFAAKCWETQAIEPLDILFWNTRQKLCGYQNMEHLWSSNTVAKGASPTVPLEYAKATASQDGTADAFMRKNGVYGLLVTHKGRVLLERYRAGFREDKRWTSFSMAKSLTGLLVGAAVAEGHIKSLDDRVAAYQIGRAHV